MRIANNDAPKLARSTLIHVNAGETVSGYVGGVSSATAQAWWRAAYETKLEQAFVAARLVQDARRAKAPRRDAARRPKTPSRSRRS